MGDEIFRTRADRPCGLLYIGHRVFLGVKGPWSGVDHSLPSSAEVKESVAVLYSLSGPSWPVLQ